MQTIMRYVWAFPLSVLGVLCALLTLPYSVSIVKGCVEVRTLLPIWPGMGAFTMGHVISYKRGQDPNYHRPHEHGHVWQCEHWGIFLLVAYPAASVVAIVKHGWRGYYEYNAFEIEAREYADAVDRSLLQ